MKQFLSVICNIDTPPIAGIRRSLSRGETDGLALGSDGCYQTVNIQPKAGLKSDLHTGLDNQAFTGLDLYITLNDVG